MTMTLAESVAQLDVELAEAPMVARGILDITVLWQPKVDAIRAAVCDFGLAAVETVGHKPRNPLTEQGIEDTLAGKHDEANCSACRAKAEINRGFGKVLEEPK